MKRQGRTMRKSSLLVRLARAGALAAGYAGAATSGEDLEQTDPPQVDPLVERVPITAGSETADRFPPEFRRNLDSAFNDYYANQDGDGSSESERRRYGFMAALRTFMWLCVILGAILFLYYVARRVGKRTPFLAGPHLGTILGRVHLSPRVCLHFVRVRDRVLVVGVTNTTVSRVAEFDADLFEAEPETPMPEPVSPKDSGEFMEHFQASLVKDTGEEPPEPLPISGESEAENHSGHFMETPAPPEPESRPEPEPVPEEASADDEFAALRDGIERLQKQIQDTSRELDL
jgi:flagellar biogenesis protein FliO